MRTRRLVLALLMGFVPVLAACPSSDETAPAADATHVVVDTDMGTDDVMALLYLLRRPDVVVDAVTVVGNGLAHLEPGVENARSLLAMAGHPDVPVAGGGEEPLAGANAFPDEWRTFSDDLTAIGDLPRPTGEPYEGTAAELLAESLDGDATLVTLGPLTNVAEALHADPSLADRVPRMVSMAGAIDVPGNAPNGVAEFNVWVDPVAARDAFEALPAELVPLDATNAVPMTPFFVDALGEHPDTVEARAIHALLETNAQIDEGTYYFWDPLAAALVVEPDLATWDEASILVTDSQDAGAGWLYPTDRGSSLRFATGADALTFERGFLSTIVGSEVADVRPEPDLTISFDGETSIVEPRSLSAGEQVIVFDNRSDELGVLVIGTFERVTYRAYVDALGGPGAEVTEPPSGFEPLLVLQSNPGSQAYGVSELPAGRLGVFSVVAVDEEVGIVWPAGVVVVRD